MLISTDGRILMNRRLFLKNTTCQGIVLPAMLSFAVSKSAVGANEKIRLGLIGCGGRGLSLLKTFSQDPRVEIAYLADPDENQGNSEFEKLKESHNPNIKKISDFRKLLEDKNVDAVIIATPDYWHALATILACQAGKDVYVEKPLSHNIWEGRKIVEAARKYNRIVQVGMQGRSAPYLHQAKDYIQSGKIGSIHLCKVYNMKYDSPYHRDMNRKPKDNINTDLWLGPASEKYANLAGSKNWLYHWDFCNGDIMNDGIHQGDLARWLMGKTFPNSAYSVGGNLAYKDDREVPDTQVVNYEFGDMVMTFEVTQYTPYMEKTTIEFRETDQYPYWPQDATRIEIYGSKDLMIVGRHGDGWQVFTNGGKIVDQGNGGFPDRAHRDNFLECLESRKKPNADVEEGHISCAMIHCANISYRLGGKKLCFHPDTETFQDSEADRLVKRLYREPYSIPEKI